MKVLKTLLLVTLFSIFLQGCFGKKNEIKKDVVFLQSSPVCTTDAVCQAMWDAAGKWVDLYSPQGIETYSDEMIRSEERELGSEEMEIVVAKVKQSDGSYKIIIDNLCDRSKAGCSAERSNMIAFNKKLAGFMSAEEQKAKEKLFNANRDINDWFVKYSEAMTAYNANALSQMFHFPVTYIENDGVEVVATNVQLPEYLQNIKNTFTSMNGKYIRSESIDIFQKTDRSVYVNVIFNLYDIENTVVAAQQVGFHLVAVDGQWKMLSAAVHSNK